MGLPLFVAPVESDLPSKAPSKRGATSPLRSGIRRLSRAEAWERRHGFRRGGVRIYGPVQRSMPPASSVPPPDERSPPWVEAIGPSDHVSFNTTQSGPRPVREALRDMTRNDDRRRERLEERMTSLFGSGWQEMTHTTSQRQEEPERPDGDLGWWSVEPRPRARRARVVAPVSTRFDRSPDRLRVYNRSSPIPSQLSRQQSSQHESNDNEQSRAAFSARARTQHPRVLHTGAPRRAVPSRRGAGVDGLGDRDRSLSPEVWDTLLSTLTPDPQPPSAGSSFASAVVSQSTGGSTNTPTTVPDLSAEAAADLHCESGCENSDMEMDDPEYERPGYRHSRREDVRLSNLHVPSYNLDGPTALSISRRGGSTDPDHISRRSTVPDGPAQFPWTANLDGVNDDLPSSALPAHLFENSRDRWIGQFSVGAATDDDLIQSQLNQSQPPSQPPSARPGQSSVITEEDWSGMRRIVRSLARREDIPDEWWAEAGLSRTPPQEETNSANVNSNSNSN